MFFIAGIRIETTPILLKPWGGCRLALQYRQYAIKFILIMNHLAQENSPYLLQHAENPVDWYPWGPEALEKARREDKPIFLSIGYAACHWCHVMAHESFEDPATAAYMNAHFVNIKVDREERPDLDSIYMQAVVALTGQGGWPMSVFLTPDGIPFYGGTYFPPVRRYNMPSFIELLQAVAHAWENDRPSLLESGQQILEHVRAQAGVGARRGARHVSRPYGIPSNRPTRRWPNPTIGRTAAGDGRPGSRSR